MEEVTYPLPFALPLTPLRVMAEDALELDVATHELWLPYLRGVHPSFPVLFWASPKADRRSEKCFDAFIGEMEAKDYISMV